MNFRNLPLGEVAEIQIGPFGSLLHKSDYIEGGVAVINPMHIAPNGISADSSFSVPASKANELKRYLLHPGEVIMGRRGEMGRCAVVQNDHAGMICGTGSMKIIPHAHQLNPEYLVHMLRTPKARSELENAASGVTMLNLNAKALANIQIPLPPLEEQKRIAGILDQADALRRLRTRALDKLNTLGQAIFHEMFGDPADVSEIKLLGVLSKVVRGSSPRPQGDPRYFGGSVPRLMIADITRDGMLVTPKIDSLTELGATKSRPMQAGSVVMAVSGAAGLPAILAKDACIHDGFVGFRDLDANVNPRFLYHVLDVQRVANRAKGTGAIWSNLTTDQVKRFEIPIPNIDRQNEFVSQLTTMEEKLAPMAASELKLDNLFTSLQHRAFHGEL